MRKIELITPYILLAALMCFGSRAFSQTLTKGIVVESAQADSKFGLNLSVSQNSNLKQNSDDEYSTYTDVLVVPTYSHSLGSFALRVGASQSQVDDNKFLVADSRIDVAHTGQELSSKLKLTYPLLVTLPTSKVSRVTRSLQSSLTLRPTFTYTYKNLNLAYGLGLTRSFHKYSTSSTGLSNNQHGVSNLLSSDFTLWKKIILSASFLQRNNFSYEGYLSQSFRHDEELAYLVNDTVSVAVGHSNEGSALKPNGQETANILDRNKSEVYLSVSATF